MCRITHFCLSLFSVRGRSVRVKLAVAVCLLTACGIASAQTDEQSPPTLQQKLSAGTIPVEGTSRAGNPTLAQDQPQSAATIRTRIEALLGAYEGSASTEQWRSLGPAATPILAAIATDKGALPIRRARSVGALASIGGSDNIAMLKTLALNEQEPTILRMSAVRGLGELLPESSQIAELQPLLRAENWQVRGAAAQVLSRFPGGCAAVRGQAGVETEAWGERFTRACGGVASSPNTVAITPNTVAIAPNPPPSVASIASPAASALPGQFTIPLGSFQIYTDQLSQPISVNIPAGATSFEFVGIPADLTASVVALRINDPIGEIVYDYARNNNAVKILPPQFPGSLSVLLPNSPSVPFQAGVWTFRLLGTKATTVDVNVLYTTSPGSILNANLFFVGVPNLNAQTAQTDPKFQQVISTLRSNYSQVGLTLGNLTYIDILGPDATRFTDVRDYDLGSLFQLSSNPQASDNAVNIFLVDSIVNGGYGYTILGESGGIPGTPIRGTTSSGLAVSMANFPLGLNDIALTIAHETSHWLGNFHTTESDGGAFDPLPDTPQCPQATYDTDNNYVMEPQECITQDATNLMFWTSVATIPATTLTPNQGFVMLRNPIVYPPPPPIPVTIASDPAGLAVSVSGVGCQPGSYMAPQTLSWTPGSSCTVSFASPQSGTTGTRYLFSNWADDATAPASRTMPTPAAAITYTARFTTQYLLTTVASPANEGSISPASSYVNAGSTVTVTATPKPMFLFSYFRVASNTFVNPLNLIVSAPVTVTANFVTPQVLVAQMIAYVQYLANAGTLTDASGLIAKLNGINSKLNNGSTATACNQLSAFIHETYDLMNSGQLSAPAGQALINAARSIQVAIGC